MHVHLRTCTECGDSVSPDAPMGLCPKCLVRSVVFGQTTRTFREVEPEEVRDTLQSGLMVANGRFRLQRQLGRGGMGVVWLAEDNQLSNLVALKFLAPEIHSHAEALQLLRTELLHARRLRHRNIVTMFDWHEEPEEPPFVSMEYVAGEAMSNLRKKHPGQVFAWGFLHPFLTQLGHALIYAHEEEGILHRDLKPGNLMVTESGQIKLADFGLAQTFVPGEWSDSRPGRVSGTLLYMSPQQYLGQPPQPTDDIYSLGATLYELLTGTPPIYPDEIHAELLHGKPQPISERLISLNLSNPLPPRLKVLIGNCLQKEPELRPQSVREFLSRMPPPFGQPYEIAPAFHRPEPAPVAPLDTYKGRMLDWLREGALWFIVALILTAGILAWRGKLPRWIHGADSPSLPGAESSDVRKAAGSVPDEATDSPAIAADSQALSGSSQSSALSPAPPAGASDSTPRVTVPLRSGSIDLRVQCVLDTEFEIQLLDAGGRSVVQTFTRDKQWRGRFPAGKFTLLAKSYRYPNISMQRTLEIKPDQSSAVRLDLQRVRLILTSTPSGAQVYWKNPTSGETTESTTPNRSKTYTTWPGLREFTFTKENYLSVTTNVLVMSAGEESGFLVHADLRKRTFPEAGRDWTQNALGMAMRWIGPFWMSATEVTRGQFGAFVEATGYEASDSLIGLTPEGVKRKSGSWKDPGFPGLTLMDDLPVVAVSWEGARAFCEWLTESERCAVPPRLAESQSYRLPTDAEYDRVFESYRSPREGLVNLAGYRELSRYVDTLWPWPLEYSTDLRHEDAFPFLAPVRASGDVHPQYRLYDLHGNVAEWCLDPFRPDQNPPEIRRLDPDYFQPAEGPGRYRTVRGGSWFDHDPVDLQPEVHHRAEYSEGYDRIGFRIVLTQKPISDD